MIKTLVDNTRPVEGGILELSNIPYAAKSTLVEDLSAYIKTVFEDPQSFADLVGTPDCEIYTSQQIIEQFNEACDYDTRAYLYVSRLLPKTVFAAKKAQISMSRLTGVPAVKKLIAIKNQDKWHNASKEEVIQHLIETTK